MSVYFGLALFSTGIFIVQFILSFFIGELDLDTDIDLDGDGVDDFSIGDLVSFKGLIHFLIGFSWTMWFSRDSNQWIAACCATGVGLIFVFILSLTYKLAIKLKNEIEPEKGNDLVGRSAEIYLKGEENRYTVYTTINGAKRELEVTSRNGTSYSPGTIVTIESYKNNIYYIN